MLEARGDRITPAAFQGGRAGGIRTHDLLNPIQAHYQAVLRPDPVLRGKSLPARLPIASEIRARDVAGCRLPVAGWRFNASGRQS